MKNLGLGFDLGKKMNRTQDCELVNGLSFTRPGGRAPVLRVRGRTAAGEDREALPECRAAGSRAQLRQVCRKGGRTGGVRLGTATV